MVDPSTTGRREPVGARRVVRAITLNIRAYDDVAEFLDVIRPAVQVPDLDLIVLPESCRGVGPESAEPLAGPTLEALAEVAREAHAYLLVGLYVTRGNDSYVSAILLDRSGAIAGVYDKRYPYWGELELDPQPRPGAFVASWVADFGVIGAAICFDINFPHVWADLADAGVELVVWPSAYAGGTILGSYAQIHHFHVLSCTRSGDSRLYDPIGAEIGWSPGPLEGGRLFDIDLSRGVYHDNFNKAALRKLLAEHGDEVEVEVQLPDEEWFVLRKRRDAVDVRALAHRYGLEELRDYVSRSRHSIDAIRRARSGPTGSEVRGMESSSIPEDTREVTS